MSNNTYCLAVSNIERMLVPAEDAGFSLPMARHPQGRSCCFVLGGLSISYVALPALPCLIHSLGFYPVLLLDKIGRLVPSLFGVENTHTSCLLPEDKASPCSASSHERTTSSRHQRHTTSINSHKPRTNKSRVKRTRGTKRRQASLLPPPPHHLRSPPLSLIPLHKSVTVPTMPSFLRTVRTPSPSATFITPTHLPSTTKHQDLAFDPYTTTTTTTAVATMPRSKHVTFLPTHPAAISSYSRGPTANESWTLYNFEVHARSCPDCRNPYTVHRSHRRLCDTGHALAQSVATVVYSRDGGVAYAVDGREAGRAVRMEIPGYTEVKSLMRAMERSLRHRRTEPIVSLDQNYYVAPRGEALGRSSRSTTRRKSVAEASPSLAPATRRSRSKHEKQHRHHRYHYEDEDRYNYPEGPIERSRSRSQSNHRHKKSHHHHHHHHHNRDSHQVVDWPVEQLEGLSLGATAANTNRHSVVYGGEYEYPGYEMRVPPRRSAGGVGGTAGTKKGRRFSTFVG